MNLIHNQQDPHIKAAVFTAGEPLADARAAMILIHGRGASAYDILSLSSELKGTGFAFLAPQAENHTWYPYRFNVPRINNEPWLTSALDTVKRTIDKAIEQGIQHEKIILLGFSQGACLVLDYAARNPHRFGGVIGLSGGLIGADNEIHQASGNLADTPVFLGCSDVDFHIPEYRVHQAAEVFKALGARVETRIYTNMGHTINDDELAYVQSIMDSLKE